VHYDEASVISSAARWENDMSQQPVNREWGAPGPDDPPTDYSREMAAYEKERARLVREHLGKIALVHQDEVVGAFATADEAFLEGFRRFGLVRMMLKEIRDPDLPDFVSHVDINHPSFKRLD
jgi:hypothetical protein